MRTQNNVYNEKNELLILESLSNISQTQLIIRSDIKKEIVKSNIKGNEKYLEERAIQNIIQRRNIEEFIPISYEIIPKTIMNIMFQTG